STTHFDVTPQFSSLLNLSEDLSLASIPQKNESSLLQSLFRISLSRQRAAPALLLDHFKIDKRHRGTFILNWLYYFLCLSFVIVFAFPAAFSLFGAPFEVSLPLSRVVLLLAFTLFLEYIEYLLLKAEYKPNRIQNFFQKRLLNLHKFLADLKVIKGISEEDLARVMGQVDRTIKRYDLTDEQFSKLSAALKKTKILKKDMEEDERWTIDSTGLASSDFYVKGFFTYSEVMAFAYLVSVEPGWFNKFKEVLEKTKEPPSVKKEILDIVKEIDKLREEQKLNF
ncbi:MAG: hypothetical protein ABIF92_01270, partial [archaeon]